MKPIELIMKIPEKKKKKEFTTCNILGGPLLLGYRNLDLYFSNEDIEFVGENIIS